MPAKQGSGLDLVYGKDGVWDWVRYPQEVQQMCRVRIVAEGEYLVAVS
jgi:hypothetical protein